MYASLLLSIKLSSFGQFYLGNDAAQSGNKSIIRLTEKKLGSPATSPKAACATGEEAGAGGCGWHGSGCGDCFPARGIFFLNWSTLFHND